MDLRLNPFYKKSLMLAVVLGPIVWLVFTEDGHRRTDLAILYLFGKGELNLAIEKLHSSMTEARFRGLFPELELTCDTGANPFGNRLCSAELGAFNAIPARAFTLFLQGDELRAAKLTYRRAYHETLRQQLTRRLGKPDRRSLPGPVHIEAPLTWTVDDGLLVLPPEEPKSDQEAALIWLSESAMQRRLRASDERRIMVWAPSPFTHGVESATMANHLQPSKEAGGSDMNGRKRVVRLGVDIGKNSFHLWGVNEQDERVVKKKVRRCALLRRWRIYRRA